MRRAAVLALIALAVTAPAQDWRDEGGITSRQYQKQNREGGRVTSTEFFTLEYSVQSWLEEVTKIGDYMACMQRCLGQVHKEHAVCDYSCDEKCEEQHRKTVKGRYTPDRAAMNEATRAANSLAAEGGGTNSPSDWSSRVSQSLANLRREARRKKTFELPPASPCSIRSWKVGTKRVQFHVRGTMRKVGFSMAGGVRTPINQIVGSHEQIVAEADIVEEEPLEKNESVFCECREVPPTEEEQEQQDQSLKDYFGGAQEFEEAVRSTVTGLVLKSESGIPVKKSDVKVQVKPNDMNSVVVEVTNNTDEEVEAIIPPGTLFESSDPSVQDMVSVTRSRMMLMPSWSGTIYVSLRPAPSRDPMNLRWACLEMNKKEPGPDHTFTMRAPKNDALIRLAGITNKSRFKGPQDQGRIWILTDRATRDEINKRMMPGVTPERYATLLYEVATVGGVDFAAPEYFGCTDPNYLAAVPLNEHAAPWLIEVLSENPGFSGPVMLSSWVKQNAGKVAALAGSDPDFGPAHVANVATALLSHKDLEIQRSGAAVLASVPAQNRAAVAAAGGLAGLRFLVMVEPALAVETLLAYTGEEADTILGAAWEQLPSEDLKARVRTRLGIKDELVAEGVQ